MRVLARLFRRLFLDRLQAAFDAGALTFFTDLAPLNHPNAFARRLAPLRCADWVVYAKAPFGGLEQVLASLARYTHRVAIANSRLLSLADDCVRFRWKDYRHPGKPKVITLATDEFIRRFLLHVLPDRFHRIRHYGFLANGHRAANLTRCRKLLAIPAPTPSAPAANCPQPGQPLTAHSLRLCSCCGGHMIDIALIPRAAATPVLHPCDTS